MSVAGPTPLPEDSHADSDANTSSDDTHIIPGQTAIFGQYEIIEEISKAKAERVAEGGLPHFDSEGDEEMAVGDGPSSRFTFEVWEDRVKRAK